MKKILFGLLLLSVIACKKSNDNGVNNTDSKYLITVKCTNCNFSLASFGSPTKDVIIGTKTIAMNYVPSKLEAAIWSNLDADDAIVTFKGGTVKYAEIFVFSGKINKNTTMIAEPLPPTR
jgi:hypothetical protein